MKNITIKNFEARAIVNMLSDKDSLLNSNSPEKKIPMSVLWAIDENFRKLSEISQKINAMEQKIQQKYADDEHSEPQFDDDGNETGRFVKDSFMNAFTNAMNELMLIDNDISISTIPLSSIDRFITNGHDFQSIRFMIENDNPELKSVAE